MPGIYFRPPQARGLGIMALLATPVYGVGSEYILHVKSTSIILEIN